MTYSETLKHFVSVLVLQQIHEKFQGMKILLIKDERKIHSPSISQI